MNTQSRPGPRLRRVPVLSAALACAVALVLMFPGVAAASDRLLSGQSLSDGQVLTSADGHYRLVMQSDGNLVLYAVNGTAGLIPLWDTGTIKNGGDSALLQGNGNLAVYTAANQVLWSSNTNSPGCSNLIVQDDGNLVMYNGTQPVWASKTLQSLLRPGQELTQGEAIYSADERYELIMQGDGNLVLYGPTGALWASRTVTNQHDYAIMQGDGNLVVYTTSGGELWASNTGGHPGSEAVVQTDGNFVVYQGSTPVWNSSTEGTRASQPTRFAPPAFQACPPPPPPAPAPVVSTPTPTPVPALPGLKVRMTINWTWNRGITHLHRITIGHLPRRTTVTESCHGQGCPAHSHRVGRRQLRRLTRFLDGRAFRAGDRITLTVSKSGYRAEQVTIAIRYGRVPLVNLTG